jgi:hypothetical protein
MSIANLSRLVWGLALLLALIFGFIFVRKFLVKAPVVINTSGASVVKQLQALSRYETASYTIEKIIDAGTTGNQLQELLYGDRILLIAHGVVIAGFDLSSLPEKDAKISGDSIELTLPAPSVLMTRLDSEKTRVYDRRMGVLTHGDKDLESKARVAAEQSIREAACQQGVLEKASENAKKQLSALLQILGFVTVSIIIPQGQC